MRINDLRRQPLRKILLQAYRNTLCRARMLRTHFSDYLASARCGRILSANQMQEMRLHLFPCLCHIAPLKHQRIVLRQIGVMRTINHRSIHEEKIHIDRRKIGQQNICRCKCIKRRLTAVIQRNAMCLKECFILCQLLLRHIAALEHVAKHQRMRTYGKFHTITAVLRRKSRERIPISKEMTAARRSIHRPSRCPEHTRYRILFLVLTKICLKARIS